MKKPFFQLLSSRPNRASRPPPFLLGAMLVFWGWQTDLMIWALPMALLIEAPQYLRARWEFSNTDLNRLFDLCVVLGIGIGVVLYANQSQLEFFFHWIQFMPFYFLPITLAQVFGSRDKMPLSVFSWVLRRHTDRPLANLSFDFAWIYFALCIAATSATNGDNPFFYYGIVLLVILALASIRPRRLPVPFWLGLVSLAAVGGMYGQRLLHSGQADLEVAIGNWLAKAGRRGHVDPNEVLTAIGQSGRMRLSGKIILRVKPEHGKTPPKLLREATYQSYRRSMWRVGELQFDRAFVDTNDHAVLMPNEKAKESIQIASYLNNGKGMIAMPAGTVEVHEFTALLETNRFGGVRADGGPNFINFTANYNPELSLEAPPDSFIADSEAPRRDRAVFEKIVDDLKLKSLPLDEKLRVLADYFEKNYTYTLIGHNSPAGVSPIADFLTETHSGHCEHFATAGVLLLRTAGVAARYAVGYAVPETGRHGDVWYVRERHGHAWVMVYREDQHRWEDFDPTPSSREAIEESRASALEGIADFGSAAWFQFSKWRWGKGDLVHYAPWLLVPLALFLVWRVLRGKRRRADSDLTEGMDILWPGLDSELYLINRKLKESLRRRPEESLADWQLRLTEFQPERLRRIFALHRRMRFDPNGLVAADRVRLKQEALTWLEEFEKERTAQLSASP